MMPKAIEQSKKMAGHLDPDAQVFIPGGGSSNSRTDPHYDRVSEGRHQSDPRYPPFGGYNREQLRYDDDDRYYDNSRYPPARETHEPKMNEPSHNFPTSKQLRDFYQELQSGGWENNKRTQQSRAPQRQTQRSPSPRQATVQHSPPPQAGSRPTPPRTTHHLADRRSPPGLPVQRSSPPRKVSPPQRRSPHKQHASPQSFARSSLERKSATSTPSPPTENRGHNEANSGHSAPKSRERQSPNSAERSKHSPPKIDISYDADAEVNLIRSQLEFYFSDKNLSEENNSNLVFYMLKDKMWVPLHVVCALPKIRDLGGKKEDVLTALRTSSLLELNHAENKVRRPGYQLPLDFKIRKSLRRSVLVYGLPQQMTDAGVRSLLESHGNILCVAFPNQNDGPDIEMGRIIMKKKLGDPANLLKLTCAFVVFESQSQANKCVKARSRSSPDGIRTMHKYDYNKVVKRLGKGMSPNHSPLWTPNASPSFSSEPRSGSLSGVTPTFSSLPGGFKLSPAQGSHGNPHYGGSRSMSRSPVVRSTNSRSPFYRSHGSPGMRSQRSPSWKLEDHSDSSNLRQRSSSMQNRRVIVATGPDNTKGFRWPRNPQWKSTRTTLDVLNTTMV